MITIGIDASRANVAERTGTEWYIFNLIQQLKTIIPTDHYRVVLYSKEPLRADLLPLPPHWESKVLRWPPQLLWTQLRLSLTMLVPWQRPDVLFIPAHTIPVIHPKHTVYVAHDLGFERFPELYANTYIGGKIMNAIVRIVTLGRYGSSEYDYHRWSMRYAVHHASQIITISQFTKSELLNFYQPLKQTISVVHNGFTGSLYQPDTNQTSAQPYLLYVGRIEDKKNILNLIEAFGIIKKSYQAPLQLWLVGKPGYGYEKIRQRCTVLGLDDSVQWLGYVPQADLPGIMQRASLFVFPTNYEGFGIPVLEALASGTAVACSDLPVLREICGDACSYFNQTKPAHMAEVIQQQLQLPAETKVAQQVAGIQQAKTFSWKNCAEATWQALQLELHI